MPCLIRRLVMSIFALLVALGPVLGLTALVSPPAAAFYPDDVHIPVFRAQLGAQFSPEAAAWVEMGLIESDYLPGQGHPEWHFDSANDPVAICDRWTKGPKALLDAAALAAVEGFRVTPGTPDDPKKRQSQREETLKDYGQYLHAIQDFYAHTNWIELHVAAGKQPNPAPIVDGCDAATLNSLAPGLRSGYFNADTPPDFCGPRTAARPPITSGSTICHGPPNAKTMAELLGYARNAMSALSWLPASGSTAGMKKDLVEKEQALVRGSTLKPNEMLAKDVQNEWHGNETFTLPDGTTMKFYDEAVRLATLATAETFPVFQRWVVAKLGTDLPDRDPECLFQVLVKGGDPACPRRVVPGGHYQGEVAIADANTMARFADPFHNTWDPRVYSGLRSFRVEITLDLTTNQITAGDLFFQIDQTSNGALIEFDASKASGYIVPLPDGINGLVEFRGTQTIQYSDNRPGPNPQIYPNSLEGFSLAGDQTGRLVLCRSADISGEVPPPETQRQDCLDRELIELKPAP